MSTSPLTVTHAYRRFGAIDALAGAELSLRPATVTAIVGPNGSGKTTLMEAIVGLQSLDSGAIAIGGAPLVAGQMHHTLGYLAQDRPLYKNLTVGDHLSLGAKSNPTWDADYASGLIADGGLSPHQRVAALSGGQRTRLALGLTLGRRPSTLILDEPLADLDPVARLDVQGVLMADVAERGTSILLSSHVLAEVADIAEDLVIMHSGRMIGSGELESFVLGHQILVGPSVALDDLTFVSPNDVLTHTRSPRQTSILIRDRVQAPEGWQSHDPTLEEVVVAYLRTGTQHTYSTAEGAQK